MLCGPDVDGPRPALPAPPVRGAPARRPDETSKNHMTDLISDHTFHFTALPVEQQLLSDLQPLNQFAPEALQAMTEMALSFLAQQSADPDGISMSLPLPWCTLFYLRSALSVRTAALRDFASEHSLGLKAAKTAATALIFFLAEALKRNMAAAHVKEDLAALGTRTMSS
jgi:hypothetical protein